MKRAGAFILAFVALFGPSRSLRGAEVAIQAPVNCRAGAGVPSCGEDTTLSQARKDRAFLKRRYPQQRLVSLDTHLSWVRILYLWGYVEDFQDGQSKLSDLLNHAKTGEIFNPPDDFRYQIVEALPIIQNQQRLARCLVLFYSSGLPRDCETVAVAGPDGRWLMQGKMRVPGSTRASPMWGQATFRPSGFIKIEYEVRTTKPPILFAYALRDMLTAKQDLVPIVIRRPGLRAERRPCPFSDRISALP